MNSLSRDFEVRHFWMACNLLNLRAGDGDRTRDVQLGNVAINRKLKILRVRACCSAYRNAWSLRSRRMKPWEWSTKGAQHIADSRHIRETL